MLHFLFEHNGVQQVVELQLALEVLSALQPIQHELYEVVRHVTLESFVTSKPIFATRDSGSDEELVGAEVRPVQVGRAIGDGIWTVVVAV